MPKRGQQKGTSSRRAEFIEQLRVLGEGTECVYWPWSDIRGQYTIVHIDGKRMAAHRWVYEQINGVTLPANVGMGPGEHVIMHTCDNQSCCNPRHLVRGTPQENTMDAVRKGRLKGNHTHVGVVTKIPLDQVEIIKRLSAEGVAYSVIARAFGVSGTTVSEMVRGKTRVGVPHQKLSEADYAQIRQLATMPGVRQAHIARAFGVSDTTIMHVVRGRPPR